MAIANDLINKIEVIDVRILVLLKQTFDTEAKIQLTPQGEIDETSVNRIINPFDEFALEEGLRLKEKHGGEVLVISLGTEKAQEALRQALAMGADRAILITGVVGDSAATAEALAAVIRKEPYDIILCGWRAIDDQAAQVPGRLAEILNLPFANVVTKLDVDGNKGVARAEVEGGFQMIEFPLPAIVTAQRGLNEPRYPSMKGIIQAKKKELRHLTVTDLDVVVTSKSEIIGYVLPETRRARKIIQDEASRAAKILVELLHSEAKVV